MTLKNSSSIFETIDLTWPAENFLELRKWKLRKSIKGGKRVKPYRVSTNGSFLFSLPVALDHHLRA